MDKKSLTHKTIKDGVYNLLSFGWPIFIALLITPIIIRGLGIRVYGIYIFVGTVVSFLGLLDIGLGTAITKHISHEHGKNDKKSLISLIKTSNSLFWIVGTVGLLISIIIYFVGPELLPAKFEEYKQYSSLFLIGGFIFFIDTISRTFHATLVGFQKFQFLSKIGIVSLTIYNLMILLIALTSKDLAQIFISQLIINTALAFVFYKYAKKQTPAINFSFGWDKKHVKNIYKFASVTFINNISGTTLSYLDRLIIPIFAGPSNLTYYNISGNVAGRISGITGSLSKFIFPLTSQLHGSKDYNIITKLYTRSFRIILMLAASISITLISYSYEVLYHWLGADFALKSSDVLIILTLTNFVLALWSPLSSFLFGLGKLKIITFSSVAITIINTLLLIFLLPKFGILGAAWAYLISVIPTIFVFYYTENKILGLENRRQYHTKHFIGTIFTSAIVFVINKILLSSLISNLFTVGIAGLISIMLYIVIYKLIGLVEDEDWDDLKNFIFKNLRLEKYL